MGGLQLLQFRADKLFEFRRCHLSLRSIWGSTVEIFWVLRRCSIVENRLYSSESPTMQPIHLTERSLSFTRDTCLVSGDYTAFWGRDLGKWGLRSFVRIFRRWRLGFLRRASVDLARDLLVRVVLWKMSYSGWCTLNYLNQLFNPSNFLNLPLPRFQVYYVNFFLLLGHSRGSCWLYLNIVRFWDFFGFQKYRWLVFWFDVRGLALTIYFRSWIFVDGSFESRWWNLRWV